MKRMKTVPVLLVLVFAGLATAAPALAQPNRGGGPGGGPADRMERRLDVLDQRLDLTDAQRDSLATLMAAQRAEALAWFAENEDATRAQRQAFRAEHREAMQQRLEGILTPEQAEELSTMRTGWQDRGGRSGARRPGRGRGMGR